MKKIIKCIGIVIVLVMVFSACNFDVSNSDDIKCYYNDSEYDLYDNHGNYAESCWNIPADIETEKVKVYLGYVNDTDKTPNQTASIYANSNFDMFLKFNHYLHCKKEYDFPDYRKDNEIEKIILMSDNDEDFFDASCATITDKEDIYNIRKLLVSASEKSNWENNCFAEKTQTSNIYIGIKFKNFEAVLYYGYITLDENNDYGISCYNVESNAHIYKIKEDFINIFDKYGFKEIIE